MSERKQLDRIERIVEEILYYVKPHLRTIKIVFNSGDTMNKPSDSPLKSNVAPASGSNPITLTVGQTTVASVVGWDQFGNPWTGAIPTPAWSIDQPTFDSIAADGTTPANEDVTSLAVGVANLTATVVTVEGLTISDTEQITNLASEAALTSIQIQFSTPVSPAVKKK